MNLHFDKVTQGEKYVSCCESEKTFQIIKYVLNRQIQLGNIDLVRTNQLLAWVDQVYSVFQYDVPEQSSDAFTRVFSDLANLSRKCPIETFIFHEIAKMMVIHL